MVLAEHATGGQMHARRSSSRSYGEGRHATAAKAREDETVNLRTTRSILKPLSSV